MAALDVAASAESVSTEGSERPLAARGAYPAQDDVPDELRVFKEECCYCFRSSEVGPGLFVPLKAGAWGRSGPYPIYDAVCARCLPGHMENVLGDAAPGTAVALLKTTKIKVEKEKPKGEPEAKRLAINLPGGFQLDGGEEWLEEHEWRFGLWPAVAEEGGRVGTSDAAVPADVRRFVALLRDTDGALQIAKAGLSGGVWDGGERRVTKETSIPQIPDPAPVPKSGWRCQQTDCTKKENLWLNLSDGSILCGRAHFDGSGGLGHALDHYVNSGRKYPLAVNLGTINPDGADVFSYSENDEVTDPKLRQHLAHFGLSMESMSKTEQTVEERELEQSVKLWDKQVTEAGADHKLVRGVPGLTGIENLGNSCYLNSVLQLLALTPEIKRRYVDGAAELFRRPTAEHPSEDLQFQTAKIFSALASGDYSPEAPAEDASDEAKAAFRAMDGIRPHLFRSLVGRGHAEFGTRKQQDAEEFLRYFLEKLSGAPGADPSFPLTFRTEDRFEDLSSKRVRYSDKEELILSVPLPQDLVENKEAVAAFKERQRMAKESGEKLGDDDLVRPQISLMKCLERLGAAGLIEGYKSPVTGEIGGATRQTRFLTFPDFLVMQMGRFVQGATGEVEKLQSAVEVREVMELEWLRGKGGPAAGETLLPSDAVAKPAPTISDADLTTLMGFGFSKHQVLHAVSKAPAGADPNALAEWLFMNGADVPAEEPMDTGAASGAPEAGRPRALSDGPARYALQGFVSHTGTSTHCGHYIAHVRRGDDWFLINDEKVHQSQKPAKELAYLYLFKRLNA